MFRTKIEVREYAMNKAIELLGTSTPVKDAVAKAQEIEKYIMGSAELPETIDENEIINTALETLGVVASHWLAANGVAPCKAYEPIQKAEPETDKEK
jgi:hypothetical protein